MSKETPMKDFRCRCGNADAKTDGDSLYFGHRKVPLDLLRLQWLCSRCGREMRWFSTRARKGLTEQAK